MLIEFHRNMLADGVRNTAFHRALAAVIVPGKSVVADLGAGTGFLSFLAIKLGARAAYLYEYSPALKLSEKLAAANGIKGCHFIHGHSTQVKQPVAADIIVSETFGNYAYEENIIENIEDARRFLKTGGTIIPANLRQFVAPVVTPRLHRELLVWDQVGFDLDFALARSMSLNNLYVRRILPADLLGDVASARCWDQVNFLQAGNRSQRRGQGQWQIGAAVTVYGFALWWHSELVPGVELSTSPWSEPTHWEQLYLPVLEPIALQPGETLQIKINSDTRYQVGVNVSWEIIVQSAREGRRVHQQLDMRKGDIN